MSAAQPPALAAVDLSLIEAPLEKTKRSFTKKMSKKIKALVTPRGGKSSPTTAGTLSQSSSGPLIRVPSIPQKQAVAAAEQAKQAAEEQQAAAAALAKAAVEAAVAAADSPTLPSPVKAPTHGTAASEASTAEPSTPVEADQKVAIPAAEVAAKVAEGGKATKPQQRFSLTKSLAAFAIVAVAAGAAMLLSGGAQKAAPAAAPTPQQQTKVGKGVSWRL